MNVLGLQALADRWSASRIARIHRESNELELGMHPLALAAQHVLCAAPFLVAMSAITRTLHMRRGVAVVRHDGTTARRTTRDHAVVPGSYARRCRSLHRQGLVGAAFILALVLVAFSTILLWGVFLGRDLSRWLVARRFDAAHSSDNPDATTDTDTDTAIDTGAAPAVLEGPVRQPTAAL